jgi:hypothetical protein
MEFIELLDRYGVRTTDCAVVTLGTDGLDPIFSNIICVSILPIIGVSNPVTIYIEGADIYSSAPYTRVNEVTYQTESVSKSLARNRLYELLQNYPVLIGHNAADFIQPFLHTFDARYRDITMLDTYILARYYYQTSPPPPGKASTLATYQRSISRKEYDKHRSWKLRDLCQFETGDFYNIPEANAIRIKTLFTFLLGREAPTPSDLFESPES